jgi:hypothetical protein
MIQDASKGIRSLIAHSQSSISYNKISLFALVLGQFAVHESHF